MINIFPCMVARGGGSFLMYGCMLKWVLFHPQLYDDVACLHIEINKLVGLDLLGIQDKGQHSSKKINYYSHHC